MKKIIQITNLQETDKTNATLYALTEDGRVYFKTIRYGEWYEESLPFPGVQIPIAPKSEKGEKRL